MKKRYQIDKQRAVRKFRQLVDQAQQPIQLVIPLKEVVELIQRGLMNLAMAAFTKLAEEVMGYEVTALVGPKNQADATRVNARHQTTGSAAGQLRNAAAGVLDGRVGVEKDDERSDHSSL